ncbi:putative MFS family arabinose efflux permease [Modicisalibacter xianhensis]|uniref:Putative MFS family arabinose efflux permease n=1 Tax=Modicisalibacter xianhensis TaxID=442341 RepID=A0A4R8FZD9_9GAMM|nr:MFS transporter [Halomonas xianhensis]TDX31040.1 putative MFS family arabinose efflux permease [Halomonas xianhensis]
MKSLTPLGMAALGSGIIGITYGLARFVFGLFLPSMREELTITPTMAGVIGALPFLSFVFAILAAPWVTRGLGIRNTAVAAAGLAGIGMLTIAQAPTSLVLASGVLICGISTGLSSPVMAQSVYRVVPSGLRGRVNAVINAGTSLGIALAMPAVLIWAEAWRSAYVAFTALAALGALAALVYLPRDERPATSSSSHKASISREQWVGIGQLSTLAGLMGVVSAAYWVFAPDAVITAGGLASSQTAWMWLAVGLGGLAGGGAGDLITRFGPALSHVIGLTVMSASLALLAIDPGHFPLALASAALFGVGYMTLTGFYLVRSTQIMAEAPALGPVLPLLATSTGQVAGSPLAGWLVGSQGHAVTFVLFATLGLAAALLGSWLLHSRDTADWHAL